MLLRRKKAELIKINGIVYPSYGAEENSIPKCLTGVLYVLTIGITIRESKPVAMNEKQSFLGAFFIKRNTAINEIMPAKAKYHAQPVIIMIPIFCNVDC